MVGVRNWVQLRAGESRSYHRLERSQQSAATSAEVKCGCNFERSPLRAVSPANVVRVRFKQNLNNVWTGSLQASMCALRVMSWNKLSPKAGSPQRNGIATS